MADTKSRERSESSEHTSMETTGREKGGVDEQQGASPGKSCKGYLFYSFTLRSDNRSPRCIGIPRSLPRVPSYVVEQSENETSKEGRALVDFYYACAGYSVYTTTTDASANEEGAKAKLPACVGLELIVDRRASSAGTGSALASAHAHNSGEDRESRQPQSQTCSTCGK